MREDEAKLKIVEQVSVTRQKVTIAKANLLDLVEKHTDSDRIIGEFLKRMDGQMPEKVILNPSIDPNPNIAKAAESISWRTAASEAILELIHSNAIIQTTLDILDGSINLQWTTIYEHSGGHSGGWSFDEYSVPVPRKLSIPPSRKSSTNELFANPDLYIYNLDIPNLHPDIELALQEAIRCFRNELFTACVTMLGKASEGAWLELGEALILVLSPSDILQVRKQKDYLESPTYGIGKKIEAVISLFERQDFYAHISKNSGISLQELRTAASWSDTVRDSRNTIHFSVKPSVPNSYEKVAALILGAVPHLRIIYRVIAATKIVKKRKTPSSADSNDATSAAPNR
jgi:hypothetical protein